MTIDSILNSPNAEQRKRANEWMNSKCVCVVCHSNMRFALVCAPARSLSRANCETAAHRRAQQWTIERSEKQEMHLSVISVHAAALLGNSMFHLDVVYTGRWGLSNEPIEAKITYTTSLWWARAMRYGLFFICPFRNDYPECRVRQRQQQNAILFPEHFFLVLIPSSLSVGPNLRSQKYTFHSSFCSLHFIFRSTW